MEKEIQVRKKRFAAFWMVVLLICTLVVPTTASAESIALETLAVGTALQPGDVIINTQYGFGFSYSEGAESGYGVAESYTVPSYTGESTASEEFDEWIITGISEDPVSGVTYKYFSLAPRFKQYTITFDTDGGDEILPITQEYGTAVTKPADPQKTGHTFAGWDNTIPTTMPAQNMTIKALWTANKYTIRFVDEDDSLLQSSDVACGETPVYSGETPTKAATTEYTYTFAGWTPTITAVTGKATYTATYTQTGQQYTIGYTLNGGTNGNNPGTYAYGTGVAALADAAKPGYNFAGWYETADFSGERVTAIAADRTGDVTLYAKFEMGTIEEGTYSLTAGVPYKLGAVTKVSGDNSAYVSGSTFYVSASGSYTFS